MKTDALIVFVREPEFGKVKTRLAKGIGEEKALQVYRLLLAHTKEIIRPLDCDIYIFYAGEINPNDCWNNLYKRRQQGPDLGTRMSGAFDSLFIARYKNVLIIGSDCYQLTTAIIQQAFSKLKTNEVVIGPAMDGGYYLLGSSTFMPELFKNKDWSTDQVFDQTVNDLQSINYAVLEKLYDVDEEADLKASGLKI